MYFPEYSPTSGARCEGILASYTSSIRKYSETEGQVKRFSSIHAPVTITHVLLNLSEDVSCLQGKIERQANDAKSEFLNIAIVS